MLCECFPLSIPFGSGYEAVRQIPNKTVELGKEYEMKCRVILVSRVEIIFISEILIFPLWSPLVYSFVVFTRFQRDGLLKTDVQRSSCVGNPLFLEAIWAGKEAEGTRCKISQNRQI